MNDNVAAVFSSGKDGDFTRYPYADMPSDFNALERDWYKEAMANKGKTIVTEPYESISSGKWSSPSPVKRWMGQALSPLI